MIDRTEYAKWLTSMINYRQSYHNHKEMMAWLITALYVPSVVYLGHILGNNYQHILDWIFFLVMGFIWFCVWNFVKMQFDNRWEAADVIRILLRHLAALNSGAELPRQDEWKIDKEHYYWPYFVQQEIDKLKGTRKYPEAFKALLKMVCWWLWKDDDRWKTEIPSYLLIIASTLAAVYLAAWN